MNESITIAEINEQIARAIELQRTADDILSELLFKLKGGKTYERRK